MPYSEPREFAVEGMDKEHAGYGALGVELVQKVREEVGGQHLGGGRSPACILAE